MGDAAEAAFRRKLHHYRDVIPELAAAGIVFRPLIWTADARPHPATVRTLRYAAGVAATLNGGLASATSLLSRWKHEITVAIMRRRAAMTRAVVPRQDARALWMLTGHSEIPASSLHREEQLDDHGNDGNGSLFEGAGPT